MNRLCPKPVATQLAPSGCLDPGEIFRGLVKQGASTVLILLDGRLAVWADVPQGKKIN